MGTLRCLKRIALGCEKVAKDHSLLFAFACAIIVGRTASGENLMLGTRGGRRRLGRRWRGTRLV